MNAPKVLLLVLISLLVAILLASALSKDVPTELLYADISPSSAIGQEHSAVNISTAATKNYLPIIFLNSATAGGAWLLAGNTGTNWATDFLGTTDNMTLTIRVSNTIAYRIVPALDGGGNVAPNIIGGSGANSVKPGLYGATIAGGGGIGDPNIITSTGDFATISGGYANTASSYYAAVSGGYHNTASSYYATVGGGEYNAAGGESAIISGGAYNTANGQNATIGGGLQNTANGITATIGGGFQNAASNKAATVGGGEHNIASGAYATIGGGYFNSASNTYATVGGGYYNNASSPYATVGGGYNNSASSAYAAVGGGYSNTANNSQSTVSGGAYNSAGGDSATVPGGISNVALGNYSFAAGRRAKANHQGAFIWSDSTNADFASSGNDQFLIRANGGIAFVTSTVNFSPTIAANVFITTSTGAYLSTSGVWTDVSNKNVKANFTLVDSRDILNRVSSLPITTWNYNADDPSIRHIGPTAQDFYGAFKVGQDDTHLAALDTNGVALAAIQGLALENQELKARVAALEQANGTNPLNPTNIMLGGIAGLLAFMLARQRKYKM